MIILTESETRDALEWGTLIEALAAMFRQGCVMPTRHHHTIDVPGEPAATLLLMPAWQPGRYMGVKLVSVFPGNGTHGLPAVQGSYLLSSGATGVPLAIIDGGELTARRTAAASALASRHLSNPDSSRLLVVGTGRLSANLAVAHCHVRPIRHVIIWGRDTGKAEAVAEALDLPGVSINIASDLETAVGDADVVACATLSERPLVLGQWLRPGTHLDLVGAFTPSMRETDDQAVLRARLFVDTRSGALSEGGDLVQPIRAGLLGRDSIEADLAELVRGTHPGRRSRDDITLFKSVGAASEDLAGAILAYETSRSNRGGVISVTAS